jgi:ABC-type antimicrobial peptide transport system permease subunit
MIIVLIINFDIFINFNIALISAFFIVLGSMYSYFKLINKRVELHDENALSDRDNIDKIEDPYDLYSEDIKEYDENINIKDVIKEERQKLKNQNGFKNVKESSGALFSLYRVLPYIILVVGFIGLKNNELLLILPFLAGLGVGVIAAYFVAKDIFLLDDKQ